MTTGERTAGTAAKDRLGHGPRSDMERRQNPMEQLINGVVNGVVVPVTGVIPVLASSGILLLAFAAMWLAFGLGIVANQGGVDAVWQWIGSQHVIVKGIAWLLFLPVVAGLWVWESGWPMAARIIVVAGLAGWNLLVLLPQNSPKA
jgi:hypothetical protein